jgi:hypothetical protein
MSMVQEKLTLAKQQEILITQITELADTADNRATLDRLIFQLELKRRALHFEAGGFVPAEQVLLEMQAMRESQQRRDG